MSIYRVQKDPNNPYVMVNKIMLNDKELSMRAKGLLVYMLSMPDDWQFYETELVTHFPDGIKAIRSTIKELVNLGYIEKGNQIRNDKGHFQSYEYNIYEYPHRMPLGVCRQRHTTNNDLTNTDVVKNLHHPSQNIVPYKEQARQPKIFHHSGFYNVGKSPTTNNDLTKQPDELTIETSEDLKSWLNRYCRFTYGKDFIDNGKDIDATYSLITKVDLCTLLRKSINNYESFTIDNLNEMACNYE